MLDKTNVLCTRINKNPFKAMTKREEYWRGVPLVKFNAKTFHLGVIYELKSANISHLRRSILGPFVLSQK